MTVPYHRRIPKASFDAKYATQPGKVSNRFPGEQSAGRSITFRDKQAGKPQVMLWGSSLASPAPTGLTCSLHLHQELLSSKPGQERQTPTSQSVRKPLCLREWMERTQTHTPTLYWQRTFQEDRVGFDIPVNICRVRSARGRQAHRFKKCLCCTQHPGITGISFNCVVS